MLGYLGYDGEDEIEGVGSMMYSLDARRDSRAFYGKAKVIDTGDTLELYSYDTLVAVYDKVTGELTVNGYYSPTTGRHIREFARQLGMELPKGTNIQGTYKV